jgi:hypothetical protein
VEEASSPGTGIVMSLRLRGVTDDDLPLIERWLQAVHVRSV